jgi:DNA-binding transcriptional LysR family regulator
LPDDFVSSFLPSVMARFTETYPWVQLNLICEPSKRLLSQVAERLIDVALVTEGEGAASGVVVRREPLVWASSARHNVHERDPVPLAIFHTGDVIRRSAVGQLEAHGRRARIAVTSPSFAGIAAAIDAGIAVGVVFYSSLRPGWRILGQREKFPGLPDVGIVLQRASPEHSEVVERLVDHIIENLRAHA